MVAARESCRRSPKLGWRVRAGDEGEERWLGELCSVAGVEEASGRRITDVEASGRRQAERAAAAHGREEGVGYS